jgi:hypothetical protein
MYIGCIFLNLAHGIYMVGNGVTTNQGCTTFCTDIWDTHLSGVIEYTNSNFKSYALADVESDAIQRTRIVGHQSNIPWCCPGCLLCGYDSVKRSLHIQENNNSQDEVLFKDMSLAVLQSRSF